MDENPVGASSNWLTDLVGAASGAYQAFNGKSGAQLDERRIQAPTPAAQNSNTTLFIVGGAILALIVVIFALRK